MNSICKQPRIWTLDCKLSVLDLDLDGFSKLRVQTTCQQQIFKGNVRFAKQKDERRLVDSVCRQSAELESNNTQTRKRGKGAAIACLDEVRRVGIYTGVQGTRNKYAA